MPSLVNVFLPSEAFQYKTDITTKSGICFVFSWLDIGALSKYF